MIFTKADAEKFIIPNPQIKEIVIPEGFTEIEERCGFDEATELEKVVLPESMTKIGKSAFYSCKKLSQVNFPKKLKEIGEYAFEYCTNLKDVNLNEGIEEISSSAFEYTEIEKIKLPSTVKKIGGSAFLNCKKLSDVELNEGLEEIETYAFRDTEIEKIKLPSTVKKIGWAAFLDCKKLSDVELNEGLEEIESYAFSGTNISKIKLPSSLKIISGFRGTSLSGIELPSNIERIGSGAFEDCENFKEINFPESLKTIDYYAFKNCAFSGKMDTKNVLIAFSSFNGCPLTELECCFDENINTLEIESLEKLTINNEIKLQNKKSKWNGKFEICTRFGENKIKEIVFNKKVSEIDEVFFENLNCLEKFEFNGGLENYVYESNCLYDAKKKRLIRAIPVEITDEKIKFVIPEAIKEFGIRSFPSYVEKDNVEIEIKGNIKKVSDEAVDGYSKEVLRDWKGELKKPSKAVGGAKVIYTADDLNKAKDKKIKEIKAVGSEGLINAGLDGWTLGFSKKEAYGPKRITYTVKLPFNASFDFNVNTKPTRTEANKIVEIMTALKEIQDDEMVLFAKLQEFEESYTDEVKSGDYHKRKLTFNNEGAISIEFAKKIIESYFKGSDVEYSLTVKDGGTKEIYVGSSYYSRTKKVVPDNPKILLEIKKGNAIIVFDKRNLTCKGWKQLKELIQIVKESSELTLVSKLKEIKYSYFETIDLEKIHD